MVTVSEPSSAAFLGGGPPLLGLWKSRLPLIVVPVLTGLQRSSLWRTGAEPARGGELQQAGEAALLAALALTTGRLRLPFSVTWWLVLLLAFALETELLLGVAAVLSLSVLVSWYGVQLCHPHAVSALWGGARLKVSSPEGLELACWRLWDLVVHLLPGALVLRWYGPMPGPGVVTPVAVGVSLPLNVFWLWGLGLSLPRQEDESRRGLRLWPWALRLEDTNSVYRVAPKLPKAAWLWIYGAHWFVCTLWLAGLTLPREALFCYAIFTVVGLVRMPYTLGWWMMLLGALCSGKPLLQGMASCCALTLAVGFYGTQLLAPRAFMQLVRCWAVEPLQERCPPCLSALVRFAEAEGALFLVLARLGDLCIHLVPAALTFWTFRHCVTSVVALASLPTNLLWLFASRTCALRDTSLIYGVQLPDYIWDFIYGSHWVGCASLALACFAWEQSGAASAAAPMEVLL